MAETITIEGRPYLKRKPLGVLGLSFVTLGIYFFYWYWKVNDELSTFEHDDSISPTRSLVAITLGWVIFVPPFIAIYNTGGGSRRLSCARPARGRRSCVPGDHAPTAPRWFR
jgi:Domain of unknown function (DUF4234)